MDIITHTLSGALVGITLSFIGKPDLKRKFLLILTGSIAAFLPDVDAISLWSGFDRTFGELFKLPASGKEVYFSKYWYSHHGFFHSIAAAALICLLLAGFLSVLALIRKYKISEFIYDKRLYLLAFFIAYNVHLLEDMLTPGSYWGGINLLFPSAKYYGGYGKIWWWNNYDIFLLVLSGITINSLLIFVHSILKKGWLRIVPFIVLACLVLLTVIQVGSRTVVFSYTNRSEFVKYEMQSKEIQKEILGESLFKVMQKVDNSLPVNF